MNISDQLGEISGKERLMHRRARYAAATVALAAMMSAGTAVAQQSDNRFLTVSGRGEVSAAPDMARINVGVVTEDKTAAKAVAQNSNQMTAVFSILSGLGIEEKDMQTSNFSVQPKYETYQSNSKRRDRIIGYRVFNQLRVAVRELDDLGKVLDKVLTKGDANQLNGISFHISDPEPLLDQARRNAIDDARRKASLYAEQGGVSLGKILSIQEYGGQRPQPPQVAFAARESAAADVPIARGEQALATSVTVTFALKD